MTVNEHPCCEYPHVYGVRADMMYYVKTEVLEQMGRYNELHEWLLQNDVTTLVVKQTNPFEEPTRLRCVMSLPICSVMTTPFLRIFYPL